MECTADPTPKAFFPPLARTFRLSSRTDKNDYAVHDAKSSCSTRTNKRTSGSGNESLLNAHRHNRDS